MTADVFAAGGVVWRRIDGTDRVGLVRRTRNGGDISFPKGKLDPGESLKECARREVAEELGVRASLGPFAGLMTYRVGERDKYVLFWEMDFQQDLSDNAENEGTTVALDNVEVAERLWLEPAAALQVLTYQRDRELLRAVLARR